MTLSKLIEGWRNHILPPDRLKGIIERASYERMEVCNECPFHSKNFNTIRGDEHCTSCGCSLLPKTKCLSCKCPEDKWQEIVSSEEEEELIKKENE